MANKNHNYYRIEKAIAFLLENYQKQPSLDEIAKHICTSPFHFQKIFVDWVGISPKKFIQHLTIDHLKSKIKETQSMIEAAEISGLSSQSRVHELFISIEGMTPKQFKEEGKNLTIHYGYHSSPFGICFIAIVNNKICHLRFIDENSNRKEFEKFSIQWSLATIIHKPDFTQQFINQIFKEGKTNPEKLELLLIGSKNQIKIWEALLSIPFGKVCSYKDLATIVDNKDAVRSVAAIVGQNPISYLIPCHRIITSDGTLGNFTFGKARKQSMLGWELSQIDTK
jgi:AraC family transcriptional regulator of adaptative response/methylated-DNA-[protein]-cysteine methyltransferase